MQLTKKGDRWSFELRVFAFEDKNGFLLFPHLDVVSKDLSLEVARRWRFPMVDGADGASSGVGAVLLSHVGQCLLRATGQTVFCWRVPKNLFLQLMNLFRLCPSAMVATCTGVGWSFPM